MRSYLPDFDVVTPKSLPDALDLLASGDGWRPIAGGTDLMVLMNAGKLPYRRLMAIDRLAELHGISSDDSHLFLGAAITFSDIRDNEELQRTFPLLCQAASWSGGVANQNRGTLGGNIANASPAADSSPALLVYEADVLLASRAGSRWVPYREFHTGYKQLRMNADELIQTFRLPLPAPGMPHYGRKIGTRKAQAISKVCFAATGNKREGRIGNVRIALGSVAPVPLRCYSTEDLVRGQPMTPGLVNEAEQMLKHEISPIDDIRSTSNYRTTVACNLLREFLESLA